MPEILNFRAFCRVLRCAIFASLLCVFSAFADNETTLTYECAPGSHSIMTPNTDLVNIGGTYTIDGTFGINHCAPDDLSWNIFWIKCKQGNNTLCSGLNCYISSMPAEGATCTIYFKDKNDEVEVIEITDPCDDGEILATYYSVNGVNYGNYDSNGPSNPIIEGTSLGGYPDNSCFIGFSYEQCFNDVSTSCNTGTYALSHAVANSYGEWLPGNGYGNGPDDHGTNPLYSVNLNSGHALRLSSVTADPVSHGTEFVWYCSPQDVLDTSQQYTGTCGNGGGCYGKQSGLYPITRNMNCCCIGTYVNSNNNYHLGYQVDFSHPLTINNNSNNNIEIPTRSGYVFLGYYNTPDGQAGTQYVDANGNMTSEGLSAAASQINSTPAGICAQWYAHWCQADPVTGTCSDCPQGTSSQNITSLFNEPGEYSEGATSSYGMTIGDGEAFQSGDDSDVNDLKNVFDGSGFGAGNFGVMLAPGRKSIFGSSVCISQDGGPEYIGNLGDEEKWLRSYSGMDTTPGEYCWCNINGFSVDGNNIVNIPVDNWIIAHDYTGSGDCEKYCTEACAGLFVGSENLTTLLESETGCFPEPRRVTYWCSDEAYQGQDTDKIGVIDTVYYGQSYSTGGRDADVLDSCGYNSAGYSIVGYKCFTTPYPGTEVFSPWTVNGDVDCFPEVEPNVFTITLNKNGGTSGSGAVYSRFNDGVYLNNNNGVLSNQMLTNNNNVITVPTRTDYTFKGYYSSVNSNAQYIDANGKITQTGINTGKGYTNNTTWYAQWEENVSITYSVTYDCNNNNQGTNPAPEGELESGQTVNTPSGSSCTVPTGQHFAGWNCGANVNTGNNLQPGDTFTMPAANVTCTAQWNPNTIYLAWLLNGGTINGSNAPMCTYGTSAGQNGSITPIHDPTRNGYRFTGWTVNAGLPTGYTRLSYLQSDGSQYIDTTITYSALGDIVVNVKAQSDYTSDNNSNNNIALGFGNGSGQWFGVSSAGKWNIGPAPDYSSDVSASNVTDGLEITWSGGAESLKINGVSVTSNREIAVSPTNSLQLFGRNNAGSFRGRIYYVRVFQGGALQRNYIPVQYGNALGMFDTVTGEFFGNQGTGSFAGQ